MEHFAELTNETRAYLRENRVSDELTEREQALLAMAVHCGIGSYDTFCQIIADRADALS